ncbi:MAG: hypothetical protein HQL76_06250 [Magnetococcales bacterium]|nr:hypothetical protein [Magnetococcales bacterium]
MRFIAMTGQRIEVTVGEQPIVVTLGEPQLKVAVKDEWLNFSAPVVLQSTGGWPFGENPRRVNGIAQNVPTIVDRVVMPGQYRQVKWLLAITDSSLGLGIGSEINVFMRGGIIDFTEYAITGDADILTYKIDFVVDGDEVLMMLTSFYDGLLDVVSMKIGIFS